MVVAAKSCLQENIELHEFDLQTVKGYQHTGTIEVDPGNMCNLHAPTMAQAPKQKFGYLDIKQSSKVRPRKLKTWKRRWVVLTQLSNLSSNEYVAKLDLYDNESKWRSNSSDKTTFVLENVTSIKTASSRTHQNAFEVVERHPVMVMSGATDLETYSWILTLQQIFTPEQIETPKGHYKVTILANENSSMWNLSGEFTLSVSSTCISLCDPDGSCVLNWALSTIINFSVDKNPINGHKTLLVIETGPNSPTGQSCFHFQSPEAQDILNAIKLYVCLAKAQNQQPKVETSLRQQKLGVSVSERNISNLTDNHPIFPLFLRHRSDSGNSSSTTNSGTSAFSRELSTSPVSSLTKSRFSSELGLLVEADENLQVCYAQLDAKMLGHKTTGKAEEEDDLTRTRSSSHPVRSLKSNSDYSEIKDITPSETHVSRRNSSPGSNFERLRSISTVVASIKANTHKKPARMVSFENENEKSDFDSAIASMNFSPAAEDLQWTDIKYCQDCEATTLHDPNTFDRKRSNSTPDLQAYWKQHNSVSRSENIYEDVDELKHSVQRLVTKSQSATPPALPARPVSLSFSSNIDQSPKMILKTKRSVLKKQEKCNSSETKNNIHGIFASEAAKLKRPHSALDFASTTVSKTGKLAQRSISHISSKNELTKDSCWYIHDINNILIPELQRTNPGRSSNTSAIKSPFYSSSKTNSLPSNMKDPQWLSRHNTYRENFLNNNEGENIHEVAEADTKSIPRIIKSTSSDPLISFFLDDANFESNPMVTGKLSSNSTSSNLDLLMNDICPQTLPPVTLTLSSNVNQAQTLPDFNANNRTSPFFDISPNIFRTLDLWSVNQHKSPSSDAYISSFSANPFTFDPFMLEQKSKQYAHPQIRIIEDNYMAMEAKPNSTGQAVKNGTVTRLSNGVALNSCGGRSLAASDKQVEDYVQPNVQMPKFNSGLALLL